MERKIVETTLEIMLRALFTLVRQLMRAQFAAGRLTREDLEVIRHFSQLELGRNPTHAEAIAALQLIEDFLSSEHFRDDP